MLFGSGEYEGKHVPYHHLLCTQSVARESQRAMYRFGTLNYLNNMLKVSVITYGILAVRLTGCLVVRMQLDSQAAVCSCSMMAELVAWEQLVVTHLTSSK